MSDENTNTVVTVIMKGESGGIFTCIGVLLNDEVDTVRIAFNAVADSAEDYIDLARKDILEMRTVDKSEIEVIK
jgi:hypothetical protein